MKRSKSSRLSHNATTVAIRCCAALLLFTVVTAGCSPSSGRSSAGSVSRLLSHSHASRRLQQAPAKRPATPPAAGNKTSSSGNSTAVKPKPRNPVCEWSSDSESCFPTSEAWTAAGPGMPSSHYRRAVLMASARERHCSQHKTLKACAADVKMRCLWQGGADAANATNATSSANATTVRCASSDMEEMLLWSSKGFMTNLTVIPHAMTCGGIAPARSFYSCYAFAGDLPACKALPHCTVIAALGALKNICIPKVMMQRPFREVRQLFGNLETLDAAAYGSCGAACWLREARKCSSARNKTACTALPYCSYDEEAARKLKSSILMPMWDDEGDGGEEEVGDAEVIGSRIIAAKALRPLACRHKSQEFSSSNAVDLAAQQVYKQCNSSKTQAACLGVKPSVPAQAAAKRAPVVDWKAYEAADVFKCPSSRS